MYCFSKVLYKKFHLNWNEAYLDRVSLIGREIEYNIYHSCDYTRSYENIILTYLEKIIDEKFNTQSFQSSPQNSPTY